MKQYKIVKLPNYHFVYAVYMPFLPVVGEWTEIGRISYTGKCDEELIKIAKDLVRPKTIYFDA